MTDIEALRARMREAAEKAMAATSDNWFHGEYSDIEYAPPAGDENGAHWFPLADELAPAVCDYLIAAQPSATIAIDAYTTRLREDLDRVTRERDEARKQVNGLRLSQSLDKDSAYVIRELLDRHNVQAAAFIDDHVANAIAQRDAAEAALSAEREEVERLLSAMDREEAYLHRMIDASEENGGIMHGDLEGAFHRIRDKDSDDAERAEAITKEPPHAG